MQGSYLNCKMDVKTIFLQTMRNDLNSTCHLLGLQTFRAQTNVRYKVTFPLNLKPVKWQHVMNTIKMQQFVICTSSAQNIKVKKKCFLQGKKIYLMPKKVHSLKTEVRKFRLYSSPNIYRV